MWSYQTFLPSLKPPNDLNLRLTDTKEEINKQHVHVHEHEHVVALNHADRE